MSRGTRKSSFQNKHRKGVKSFVFPWLRRFGVVCLVLAGFTWLGAWLVMSNAATKISTWAHNETIELTSSLGFNVSDVLVEGRVYTDPAIIRAIINIEKGDPLFSLNPQAAQDLIEKISWVKTAHVERRWPDTIYIGLEEHTPIALWQKDKQLSLLNTQGELIATKNLTPFKDLVIVIGEDAPQHTPGLIANLKAEEGVYERVESASRVSERRWDLTLKNGMKIRLPENDIGLAIHSIALAQAQDNLLEKDLMSLDVRDPSRMIVRTAPGAAQDYKAGYQKAVSNPGNNI